MMRTRAVHIMAVALFALGSNYALANPTGGQVASGSATINTVPGTVTINQLSNIAIINWQSFSIGAGELTKFIQPSCTSAVLNRVLGGQMSVIDGTLSANGQVYLINGNGIVVGPGGVVNTNSFTASTRDISDTDFTNNNLQFTGSNSAGVDNQGTINALGGDVYLIGKTVSNEGTITAPNGTAGLASGDNVLLNLAGQEHVFVSPSPTATSASTQTAVQNSGSIAAASAELKAANGNLFALAINNSGTIRATTVCQRGGHIYLTTDAGLIQNTGTIAAKNGKNGGSVNITGGSVWNRNLIDVSGQQGGDVTIESLNIQNDGTIAAEGTSCAGGTVNLTYSGNALGSISGLIDASGMTQGGSINFQGTGSTSEAYLSLTLNVSSGCGVAGSIGIDTSTLYLTGAILKANGAAGGGSIFLGQGNPASSTSLPLAQIACISLGTMIEADATGIGNGGQIDVTGTVVSQFQGVATASGKGSGQVGSINFTGPPASTGPSPILLTIVDNKVTAKGLSTDALGSSAKSGFEFVDPDPGSGNAFGRPYTGLFNLSTNRTLITAPGDSFGGAGAGAVYLFSDSNGALISTLRGNHAGDAIGSTVGIFSGGNFVVEASNWNNDTGAITFGNGMTGFAGSGGFVSATNSLLGSETGDAVGSGGLFPLFNGNVLVLSPHWNGNAGAVTFVNPAVGIVGAVNANNSLVGAASGDSIGSGGIIQLSNGANYLVLSPSWGGGMGAITNGSDMTGIVGQVASTNSLVGVSTGDGVGSGGSVYDPGFGYYLVTTLGYGNGAGAVTWSSDSEATTGPVSSMNSLVGSSSGDEVGSGGFTILNDDQNYVVLSPDWNNGAGAVTLGNGSTGITGPVSAANSLVGAASGDHAGSGGITVLFGDARYVVNSPDWNNGAGAVTLARDSSGVTGVIGSTNSLVGASSGDAIGSGGITVLDNGNFVVLSPAFDNGAGAVTWEDVTVGLDGVVGSSNSLVGQTSGDHIGSGGIFQLSNGNNFLVLSPKWGGGAGAITNGDASNGVAGVVDSTTSLVGASAGDAVGTPGSITDPFSTYYLVTTAAFNNGGGAVTWNPDIGGMTGVISSTNSLVGSSGDHIASGGITILYDGNYVVDSPAWSSQAGAVTWGNAVGGVSGSVSSTNSLVGANAGDKIGSGGIVQLSNAQNYLVLSPSWSGGKGAVTNLSSSDSTSGAVSATDSLVGSSDTDHVGSAGSITDTFDGYYLVTTSDWNGGAGAVTWNDDGSGMVGAISNNNSLVGTSSDDHIGSGGITVLFNGNYVIDSPNWNNEAGAVTLGSESSGIQGYVGNANSLIGASGGGEIGAIGDAIGSGGIRTLPNNDFLVLSPSYGDNAGAVTWVDGSTGLVASVSAANSLVGASSGDKLGSGGVTVLSNGNYVVLSPEFGGTEGAVTWGSEAAGVSGTVSNSNSLLGANSGDKIGSGGIVQLSDGNNYLVLSPSWSGGKGAISEGDSSSELTGVVSSSNSLVGASSGDGVGSPGSIIDPGTGYYLVRTVNFNGGAGAVTWSSDTVATTGVVSSSNSLVGANGGDAIGSGGISILDDGNYLVLSPDFGGGAGAVTWGSQLAGISGVVSSADSLVGNDQSDHIGSGGIIALTNGNYLVLSPLFDGSAGAATWGSEAAGVVGVVNAANSLTGGGPDSGEQFAGESADGSIYLISFTTDTSHGGDGRVLAGSVNGPASSETAATGSNFFVDPLVVSVEASEFGYAPTETGYYISDPAALPLEPVNVGVISGGAINEGGGRNIATGSSTANASGPHRLVTPGNGIWNIFDGIVHSAPPPAFVAQQLQLNLSPEVLAHLHEILFGHP